MFFVTNIMIPTMIKIGAVAALVPMARRGLKILDTAKQMVTTRAVKPVHTSPPQLTQR